MSLTIHKRHKKVLNASSDLAKYVSVLVKKHKLTNAEAASVLHQVSTTYTEMLISNVLRYERHGTMTKSERFSYDK